MASIVRQISPESQFPGKLHSLIEYVENRGIEKTTISWVRDGTAIMIHKPAKLMEILPLFFDLTKYQSFKRQLKMWYFKRIEEGPHKGCFEHPYFQRGKRPLCVQMSRKCPPVLVTQEVTSTFLRTMGNIHQEAAMETCDDVIPPLPFHQLTSEQQKKETTEGCQKLSGTASPYTPGSEASNGMLVHNPSLSFDKAHCQLQRGQVDNDKMIAVAEAPLIHLASPVVLECCKNEEVSGLHKTRRCNNTFDMASRRYGNNAEPPSSFDSLLEPVAGILDTIFEQS